MVIKKPRKIIIILVFLFISIFWIILALGDIDEWFRINFWWSAIISGHNVCRTVYNNWGSAIFVPTKNSTEWTLFRLNKPANIQLEWCPCKTSGGSSWCEDGRICDGYVAANGGSCKWTSTISDTVIDAYMLDYWYIRDAPIIVDSTSHDSSGPPTVRFDIRFDNSIYWGWGIYWLDWYNSFKNWTNSDCTAYITQLCRTLTRYSDSQPMTHYIELSSFPNVIGLIKTQGCWVYGSWINWWEPFWWALRWLKCTYNPSAICASYNSTNCPTTAGCSITTTTTEIMGTCIPET